ncbi:MAG: hypothetical protein LKJ25_08775 [Clostridia bacterium]|jgi:hypothetical protein|nr:hypothetical protein [Clostridia bacterium]
MILDELVTLLNETGYKIYPFGSTKIENCIVYNFVPLTSDGIKEQNRLEITVISKNMETGLTMLADIKEKLLTFGDEPKTDNILSINLNGGGSLENLETNTFHFKAFFVVTSRYRKV